MFFQKSSCFATGLNSTGEYQTNMFFSAMTHSEPGSGPPARASPVLRLRSDVTTVMTRSAFVVKVFFYQQVVSGLPRCGQNGSGWGGGEAWRGWAAWFLPPSAPSFGQTPNLLLPAAPGGRWCWSATGKRARSWQNP